MCEGIGATCGEDRMARRHLRRAAPTGFPLSKSKSVNPVFIKLGEYVGGHNISTKFYNLPNPPGTPELWPLNCPKTELAVSALQVEYPAPKNVVITIEFTTNTTGVFCVSLALLFLVAIGFGASKPTLWYLRISLIGWQFI